MDKRVITSRMTREDTLRKIQDAMANKPSRSGGLTVHELNRIIAQTNEGQIIPEVRNGAKKRPSRPNQADSPFAKAQYLQFMAAHNIQQQVRNWLGDEGEWYLGFGGLGDALLVLAACYNNPKARAVFFHNEPTFCKQWFELFGVKAFLHNNIMGQKAANFVYDLMTSSNRFKTSGHLADGLDYGDWLANPNKYKQRLVTYVPWVERFGKKDFTQPTVIICPSGSTRDLNRQRFLTPEEYKELVGLYIVKKYQVFVTGSQNDYGYYALPNYNDCHWIVSDGIIDNKGRKRPHSLQDMLAYINGANEVVSMDTWLKTYALLCGKSAKVIMTRWNGSYRGIGCDASDGVFLNKDFWPKLELFQVEELLQKLRNESSSEQSKTYFV